MAWVFGQYVVYPFFEGCPHDAMAAKLLTAAGIAVVTYINCKSTKVGTYTNNVFTLSKVLALCLLVIMGFKTMVQGVNKNLESENMWAGTSTNIGDYAQACLSGLFAYQATVYTYFI